MTNMDDQPHALIEEPAARVALLSIVGFWAFYAVIATLRGWVMDFPLPLEMAGRRAIVMFIGILLTIGLWQSLRIGIRWPLRQQILLVGLAALPFAIASAVSNYYVFNIFDPMSLIAAERARIPLDLQPTALQEIAETAISRYFLLIAWSAFFIALGLAERTRLMERRAANMAKAAQTAELRALRYQVNPHFLFNTLNSLSALVMNDRRDEAEHMILNLSNFYRTSLAGEPVEDVTLADEIELQKLYLDIERVRFPGRLTVEIELPDVLRKASVPGLILQPLVENAVKHGVSPVSTPVSIRIAASQQSGNLVISVTDTGNGKGVRGHGGGIGIANVRDRLLTRFGDDATLEAGPISGGGYRVTLTLPKAYHAD